MIRLLLSIGFVFTCLFCQSQARPDTTTLIFNAKFNTIRFDNVLIQDDSLGEITVILSDTNFCKTTVLKSKGFNNVIFIKVELADASFPELIKLSKRELQDQSYRSKLADIYLFDFILAYSYTRNRFYKVKGFIDNQFDEFFFDYQLEASTIERDILKDKKKMLNQYSVDEIDLQCLIKSTTSKKVNIQDFPCLRPSDSRVIEVNGITFTQ